MNKANFKNISVRAEETEGKKIINGVIPYDKESVPMWGMVEVIDRTAFNKSLKDGKEIRAFFNHDDSKVLGSTNSGTLVLTNTDEGLMCRCELPNTSYANDLYEVIKRNDVNTMSFGFVPVKFEDSITGKEMRRTLKEVKLEEVSFGVAFPAYPDTSSKVETRNYIFMRDYNNEEKKMIMRKVIDVEALNDMVNKEKLDENELKQLDEIISSLNEVKNSNSKSEETVTETEAAKKEPEKTTPDNDTSKKDETKDEEIDIDLIKAAVELELLNIDALKDEVQNAKEENKGE